jgi:predicted amidohydrolase YtcJ
VKRVGDAGLGLFVHCTGDRANVMALDAFEAAKTAGNAPRPMRIEHLGDFMLGPNVIERVRALDVKGNVQPGWIYTLADNTLANLGSRERRLAPFNSAR